MTLDDDIIMLFDEPDDASHRRGYVRCVTIDVEWPPPAVLKIWDETYGRFQMSQLTDEQSAGMSNVARVACYAPMKGILDMGTSLTPTIGRVVIYRSDGRNGISYDLPAIISGTRASHGGPYPDGSPNPLPVPDTLKGEVHLHVMTPGYGGPADKCCYSEHSVPEAGDYDNPEPRTWRWPQLT